MNHKTNLGIRAVLHTARKWKKTLLVFFLLLAITTLVMSGLAIADAQEEQSEELRGVTGASFTVNANNGYTLQPVTDEMIEEIAAIDGVESYNTSHWTIVNLYHQDTLMKGTDEREYVADLFYGTGCFDSEYSPLFLSGALRLTEGCHVTEGNSGIILYEGLAEKYGLSLGDTLEIKNGNPDDPLVECEIAGLFEVIADDDDEQHDEERGHGVLCELLDAAGDAAHDDEAGQREEDDAVDDGLRLVREQAVEEVARGEAAAAPGCAEDVAEVDDYVLSDVAAEDGVEAHDEEGGGYAQPAEPAHFLGELFVGADDAEAGLASQRQLAHHDDEADEQHQQQIHYQKCKAAVGAHLVREAPQVAEADSRADRGHEEAEIAPPVSAFVFHVFSSF